MGVEPAPLLLLDLVGVAERAALARRAAAEVARAPSGAMRFALDDLDVFFPYPTLYPEQFAYMCELKKALDAEGHSDCAIMSYSAKYASNFYGPFREAAASAPKGGSGPKDRKTYQMDYRNRSEAVREAVLDVEEGADVIMVKPALAYLDVIQSIRGAVDRPVAAYLVSGEYAAVEALAEKGLADRAALVHEHLTAVRRAGADILITYHARRALREGWLD